MNIEPLSERLTAFGARALDVDGHDLEALWAPSQLDPDGRPLFILARTNPTRGIPILNERAPNLHYFRFKSDAERKRYQAYYEDWIKEP
jgi:transketolase